MLSESVSCHLCRMYGCLAIQSINFSSARARFNVQTNVKRDKTDTNNPEK